MPFGHSAYLRTLLGAFLVCFSCSTFLYSAQTTIQTIKPGIGGIDYACNGTVKRLPVDILGREYRGHCVDGIEVWSWSDSMPAHFGPAQNTVFVTVINRSNETVSVVHGDFYIISLDPKHLNDFKHASVTGSIDPTTITGDVAKLAVPSHSEPPPNEVHSEIYNARGQYVGQIVSTDPLWPLVRALQEQQERQANEQTARTVFTMTAWIAQTAYNGGAISSGGYLSGYLYFGKIKGVNPMLMYEQKSWIDQNKVIQIPLGNWPITTGLAPN